MRTPKRKRIFTAALLLLAATAIPATLWALLTHQPEFYRSTSRLPPARRKHEARQFVAQSLQLRNDIINEQRWEAVFSDAEVNAWLAEDLVNQFADQIPAGVRDPRVVFEPDRVVLAFQLEESPVQSIIWVVLRVRVPEPNELELTVEKIRAGVMPVPAEGVLERIAAHLRSWGVDVRWERDGSLPVALVRYEPHLQRRDIVLEQFQILQGQVRLSGRSERTEAEAQLELPPGELLRATFAPNRKVQRSASSGSILRSVNSPAS